jgi:hypothetical protein
MDSLDEPFGDGEATSQVQPSRSVFRGQPLLRPGGLSEHVEIIGMRVRMETTNTWRLNFSRGVPQRREKRFGNGVKNLSGSADIPKRLIIIN